MTLFQNSYILSTLVTILMAFFLASTPLMSKDSLDYRYSIVGMEFYADHDIIKIKVPPWMKTSELISQIKRVVIWPDKPSPDKKTFIYVFKETDQVGETSKTGAVYIPKKGFKWSLSDWQPAEVPDRIPSDQDLDIYYTLIDQIIEKGVSFSNRQVKIEVANEYNISVAALDSIYIFVKFWLSSTQIQQQPEEEGK